MKEGIEKKAIAGRIVPGRAGAPFPQPEQCHCARIALNAPPVPCFPPDEGNSRRSTGGKGVA